MIQSALTLIKTLITLSVLTFTFSNASAFNPNCEMAARGNGQTIYHRNGRVLTYSSGVVGATWYHSNGNVFTYSALSPNATSYYSNGRVLSFSTGTPGATWYWANGNTWSYSMGQAGATWYYDNGEVWTYSAQSLSPRDMLAMACDVALQ